MVCFQKQINNVTFFFFKNCFYHPMKIREIFQLFYGNYYLTNMINDETQFLVLHYFRWDEKCKSFISLKHIDIENWKNILKRCEGLSTTFIFLESKKCYLEFVWFRNKIIHTKFSRQSVYQFDFQKEHSAYWLCKNVDVFNYTQRWSRIEWFSVDIKSPISTGIKKKKSVADKLVIKYQSIKRYWMCRYRTNLCPGIWKW